MEKIYENISQLNRKLFEGNVEPSHMIAEGEKEKENEMEMEKEGGFEIQSEILKEPSSDAKGSSYGEDYERYKKQINFLVEALNHPRSLKLFFRARRDGFSPEKFH